MERVGRSGILALHDFSDTRPAGLRGVFHFLGTFTSDNCSRLMVGEAACSFEDGVSGAADFVEERYGGFQEAFDSLE